MTNTERRSHFRYLAPTFSISFKSIQSTAYDTKSIQLSMLDFNSLGMAVQSQHNFKIGDELQLIISDGLKHEVDVVCFVCNRAKTDDGYRCGMHFLNQDDNGVTKQSLISMEQQFDEVV